ncbi:hypothetical protein OIU85_023316 [Salix viminalis]|uniref:Uncharacterized protein n=1 Tax=Salix viminalis TaxID=40686 RepID=A0A9Q0TYD5_SALVM|nr:hypothetical protein OIU85_023316 [Salix viminalis]
MFLKAVVSCLKSCDFNQDVLLAIASVLAGTVPIDKPRPMENFIRAQGPRQGKPVAKRRRDLLVLAMTSKQHS